MVPHGEGGWGDEAVGEIGGALGGCLVSVVYGCGWEGETKTIRFDGQREESAKLWGDSGGGGSTKE